MTKCFSFNYRDKFKARKRGKRYIKSIVQIKSIAVYIKNQIDIGIVNRYNGSYTRSYTLCTVQYSLDKEKESVYWNPIHLS